MGRTDPTIALVALDRSTAIDVRPFSYLTLAVDHDDAAYTWGSAVVEVEYALDPLGDRWFSFDPAVQLTTTRRTAVLSVGGLSLVRMRVTTADGGADPLAEYEASGS